jgi:hypothetical protein
LNIPPLNISLNRKKKKIPPLPPFRIVPTKLHSRSSLRRQTLPSNTLFLSRLESLANRPKSLAYRRREIPPCYKRHFPVWTGTWTETERARAVL